MAARLESLFLKEFDPSGSRTKITGGWGDGRGHKGLDWGSQDGIERGTDMHAPVNGKIVRQSHDGPFRPPNGHTAGLNIWFLGDDGSRWKFFHLDSVITAVNQWVSAGTPIARVGNSGTGAVHLHSENHEGSWSNPVDFTAQAHDAINNRRYPGASVPPPDDPPPPPPPPVQPKLTDEEKAWIVATVRTTVRPSVLDTGDTKYLWSNTLPVVTGDVQIQYVKNLIGDIVEFDVNPEFPLQLRGGLSSTAGLQNQATSIAESVLDQLGPDVAKAVADAIKVRLAN